LRPAPRRTGPRGCNGDAFPCMQAYAGRSAAVIRGAPRVSCRPRRPARTRRPGTRRRPAPGLRGSRRPSSR
jgi:hypothetical protein